MFVSRLLWGARKGPQKADEPFEDTAVPLLGFLISVVRGAELGKQWRQLSAELLKRLRWLEIGHEAAQRVGKGRVRERPIALKAAALEHAHAGRRGATAERGYEPRFADSGFAGYQHNLAMPTADLLQVAIEGLDAGVAADEDRTDQGSIQRQRHAATLHRVSTIRGLVEVVLVVEDMERSLGFYRDTLGLETISPAELPVKFLRIGAERPGVPQQIVLIPRSMASDAPMPPSRRLHHIGLEVDPSDYESERARLAGLGFEIRSGQHPLMPVEAFYLDDPDGNEIEIATWRQ